MTSRPTSQARSGAASSLSERSYPELGPITRQQQVAAYLREHKIPQMFESLVAGLMVERPQDPLLYMDRRLDQIRQKGAHFVTWETFVRHLHPRRDPLHLRMVHDPEYEVKVKEAGFKDGEVKEVNQGYQPEVFKLTEPVQEE